LATATEVWQPVHNDAACASRPHRSEGPLLLTWQNPPAAIPDAPPHEPHSVECILELTGLHHQWKPNLPPVLTDVNLELRSGTVTWIGGRNGVGKTTLLRIAAGILVPRAGTVRLRGLEPIRDRGPYQRRLGFLSAGDRGLNARMTVAQQLDYWARLAYVPRAQRAITVAETITAFGLEELAKRRVDRMSMGQRQRVRLAMALLHSPDLVLLDEPRNSLDEDGYEILNQGIAAAANRGAAVLWCSPRGEDRIMHSDASYSLEHGRLERQG
jgi:ABC-2 type transport system ATP-binding protein